MVTNPGVNLGGGSHCSDQDVNSKRYAVLNWVENPCVFRQGLPPMFV